MRWLNHIAVALLLAAPLADAASLQQALNDDHLTALDRIQRDGELRALFVTNQYAAPELAAIADRDRQLLKDFAHHLGVRARIIEVSEYAELFSSQAAGRAHLIAQPYPVDGAPRNRLAPTVPVFDASMVIIADSESTAPWTLSPSQPGWGLAVKYRDGAGQSLNILPQPTLQRQLGQQTVRWLTDSRQAAALGAPHTPLTGPRPFTWLVPAQQTGLLAAVNDFLNRHHLRPAATSVNAGDWTAMRAAGVLRLVTLLNPATYFPWQGQLLGFDYEMADLFARRHGLQIEVLVAPDANTALDWLEAGQADMAAAFLPRRAVEERPGLEASTTYHETSGVLVGLADAPPLIHPIDLHGRKVLMPRDDRYAATIERWAASSIGFHVVEIGNDEIDEVIIDRLRSGQAHYAVMDTHLAQLQSAWHPELRIYLPLGEAEQHVWAMPAGSAPLAAAVNDFWTAHRDSYNYDLTYLKYFSPGRSPERFREDYLAFVNDGAISPFDDVVRRHAARHDIDWRLVVAQMYQESRFDPQAISRAGAEGLMQIKPETARDLGLDDAFDPLENIEGGVRYLAWLRERFEPDLPVSDRMWFSLASYNGGLRHIQNARELARDMGLDDRRWFGHVEQAVVAMAPQVAARGSRLDAAQVTDYVRRIKQRFNAYQLLTDRPAAPQRPARIAAFAPPPASD